MKLSSQLFSGVVAAELTRVVTPKVGSFVSMNGVKYFVSGKVSSKSGDLYQFLAPNGQSFMAPFRETRLSSEDKIAAFVKEAFNADFDEYVKTLIADAGFPVDHDMDWSKWFEYKVRSEFGWAPEYKRDEAVHDLIIWALMDDNGSGRDSQLKRFDPTKLTQELQSQPLEKQITAFLTGVFNDRMDYVRKFILQSTGGGKELSGEAVEEGETGLDAYSGGDLNPEEEYEVSSKESSFVKFQEAFFKWLDHGRSGLQKRSVPPVKVLFNLIIQSDDPSPRFLVNDFIAETGASESSMKGYAKKLARALVDFSQVAPRGIITDRLADKLESASGRNESSDSN